MKCSSSQMFAQTGMPGIARARQTPRRRDGTQTETAAAAGRPAPTHLWTDTASPLPPPTPRPSPQPSPPPPQPPPASPKCLSDGTSRFRIGRPVGCRGVIRGDDSGDLYSHGVSGGVFAAPPLEHPGYFGASRAVTLSRTARLARTAARRALIGR